ncbi:site-specific DNA-methyltransferase [Mycoplasma amphoriforme]|uniref:site-specific DNA-methyltransferase n=1 Tax=Mycoplasma amphoriforme TaxID=273136 RepID=UPI0031BAD24B
MIESENYHALQLLEYLYARQVDCIYIDPPYNTGARDWKYNNDYVDSSDSYRHSKWLSMMEKRLKLAKKLLNPDNSVLICTIDEKEYLHLGCLLEQLFPEANIQMISSIIFQAGASREKSFSRTNEYLFFVQFGHSSVQKLPLSNEWKFGKSNKSKKSINWALLRRGGTSDLRTEVPSLFYPIIFDKTGKKIKGVGDPLPKNLHPKAALEIVNDEIHLWPFKQNNTEGRWQISPSKFLYKWKNGFVKVGKKTDTTITIYYLKEAEENKVKNGLVTIVDREKINGTIITDDSSYEHSFIPGSQWNIESHNASIHGSSLLNKIFPVKRFSFPKSLYAVYDALRFFVANKSNALILDFFAGSGTTLHAVNLLNANDHGNRRCILITNNEVSESESKELKAKGYSPGDDEWEKLGIAHYVTWPRTVCSILGKDINDKPLGGGYLNSNLSLADGFKTNAVFFKLSFLDKDNVALGRQFKELLPLLWMKAGCISPCPVLDLPSLPEMLIYPENNFAVLINEYAYLEFKNKLEKLKSIEYAFIVTNSRDGYREMANDLKIPKKYQLYRDYLDNFRINKWS